MEVSISKIKRMERIISYTTGLGIFAKQFYITRSGSLQFSDIILLFAAFLAVTTKGVHLYKKDRNLAVFIVCSLIINVMYFAVYGGNKFIYSCLYMTYNFLIVVLLFRQMIECDFFLEKIQLACKAVIITQLVLLFLGVGKWIYNGTRYIGTFNDPNQYGFYILVSFCIFYVIQTIKNQKTSLIWLILTAVAIIPSASTGMIVAYLIFCIGYVIGLNSLNKKGMITIVFTLLLLTVFAVFYRQILQYISGLNIFGVKRIINRFLKSSSSGGIGNEFLQDRGLTRIFKEPQYFLFGSGEGGWFRFKSINYENYELHSTVIGLAYYYGIVPYCFLVKWVISNLKSLEKSVLFVYIAIFLEAFSLINHRQPMFWLVIILASHQNLKTADNKEASTSDNKYNRMGAFANEIKSIRNTKVQ